VTTGERYRVSPRRVEKPWGWELIWAETDAYVGKLLFIRAGEALSLQYHQIKDEAWLVREGLARVELGVADEGGLDTIEIREGDALHYPAGTLHRVTAVEDTLIVEVSTPHLDDVVRVEDRYGREGTSAP
jgi:mannose-6-phosphate isomerase-like protein (cupin superfamily)